MLTKEKWGNATWYLFHTLAFKLNNNDNQELFNEFIGFIKIMCHELPCPECSYHAKTYINKNNIHNLKTKDELIKYLNEFHNEVNRNLGKPTMSIEECNELYRRANTLNIVHNYINTMRLSTGNTLNMMNDFARRNTTSNFIEFMNKNIIHFNM